MTRTPHYTKDRLHRIVSVPNGDWRLQCLMAVTGTRTLDPWQNISHPLDFTAASSLLRSRETT